MKATCANCGEELLGSVNTCWRCGTSVVDSQSGEVEIVEAVASPLADDDVPQTPPEVDAEHAPNVESAEKAAAAPNAPVVSTAQESSRAATSPRTAPPDVRSMAAPMHYERYAAATGGAVGALVLAIMSLVFAYFTIGALFTALLGIGMGAWGIQSNHRKLAITAMALCCLAVVVAACFGALNLYTEINGHAPWEPPPLSEPESF